MSFLRVKTVRPGAQYLYEEIRGAGGYQKSTSLGRIGFGFWWALGVLLDNLSEPWAVGEVEALHQADERDLRETEAAEQRLEDVVNPATYDAPAAPEPEAPEGQENAPAEAEAEG